MPLYEFECTKCHHRFEKIQSVSAPDPKCPKCDSEVERLLHAPAVQFKGSGWYATDYAKSSASGKSDSKDSKPAEKSDTSASTKSESKSETKSTPAKE